jgi:hypothetical protein
MAYGKRFDEWDRASLLAQLIHNDPQGIRPRLRPSDFNPLATPEQKREDNPPAFKITDPRDVAALVGGIIQIVK